MMGSWEKSPGVSEGQVPFRLLTIFLLGAFLLGPFELLGTRGRFARFPPSGPNDCHRPVNLMAPDLSHSF